MLVLPLFVWPKQIRRIRHTIAAMSLCAASYQMYSLHFFNNNNSNNDNNNDDYKYISRA